MEATVEKKKLLSSDFEKIVGNVAKMLPMIKMVAGGSLKSMGKIKDLGFDPQGFSITFVEPDGKENAFIMEYEQLNTILVNMKDKI